MSYNNNWHVFWRRDLFSQVSSPLGVLFFFVKKADSSLRLVCDWRDPNRITVKNEVCIPNVDDLFDTVQGSRFFTKLDLRSG